MNADDFHLQPTSPAIDAGSALDDMPELQDALRARTTVGNGNLDIGAIDIGCHSRRETL